MSDKQLHKKLRKEFRENVFSRDKNKCKICGSSVDLDAHHITDRHEMPNGGYTILNGITLCPKHHKDAEYFHEHRGSGWKPGFHWNDLYKLIDSSYEKAYAASLNLIE